MGHKGLHLLPIVQIVSPALVKELLRMPSTDAQAKQISMAMLITEWVTTMPSLSPWPSATILTHRHSKSVRRCKQETFPKRTHRTPLAPTGIARMSSTTTGLRTVKSCLQATLSSTVSQLESSHRLPIREWPHPVCQLRPTKTKDKHITWCLMKGWSKLLFKSSAILKRKSAIMSLKTKTPLSASFTISSLRTRLRDASLLRSRSTRPCFRDKCSLLMTWVATVKQTQPASIISLPSSQSILLTFHLLVAWVALSATRWSVRWIWATMLELEIKQCFWIPAVNRSSHLIKQVQI